MNIAGIQPLSFIEWFGKLSSAIFVRSCNFKCPWCHNSTLISREGYPSFSVDWTIGELMSFDLSWIDGVTIGGAEACHSPDGLVSLCKKIKEYTKLPIKLDTNGYYPNVVEKLINTKLIDYVALDIKAKFDVLKYSEVTGCALNESDLDKICDTLRLLVNFPHLIRTTCVPGYHTIDDIKAIARYAENAHEYVLQDFRATDDTQVQGRGFGREVLEMWTQNISSLVKKVRVSAVW